MAATEFDPEKKQIQVSISGYDLTKASDAAEVFNMINTASKRVCKTAGVRETLRERVLQNKCRADAIISAVTSIDAPQLIQIMQTGKLAPQFCRRRGRRIYLRRPLDFLVPLSQCVR